MDFLFNQDGELNDYGQLAKYLAIENQLYLITAKKSKEYFTGKHGLSWQGKVCYIHNECIDNLLKKGYQEDLAQLMITKSININYALYKRRQRCRMRMEDIFDVGIPVWFITLTFNDETLSNTTEQTRRRYVARYLKQLGEFYFANIDFGDKFKNPNSKEREHYHACVCSSLDFERLNGVRGFFYRPIGVKWNYGFVGCKPVNPSDTDKLKTSKYVAKLSNHALKQTKALNARRLIYSRNFLPF